MPTIKRVAEPCVLGEAPHWDAATQSLYYVDIFGHSILKYVPAKSKATKASLAPRKPSFIIPIEGRPNEFIVGADNELLVVSWDGENDKVSIVETLETLQRSPKAPELAFNDAKCDPRGRLWAGAHSIAAQIPKTEPLGSLYTYDGKRQFTSKIDGIKIANGLAFNETTKKFFYIDSLTGGVDRFDLDPASGNISNREVWFNLKDHDIPGMPDGMTIDTDGHLWVAVFGGGRVLKIDGQHSNNLLMTCDVPAEQVTSLAFGGENLDELYVTTAALEIEGKKLPPPENGALYMLRATRSKGLPGVSFKWN